MKKEIILSPITNPKGEVVYRAESAIRKDTELDDAYRREVERQVQYEAQQAAKPSEATVIATAVGKGAVKVLTFSAKFAWATVQTVGSLTVNILLDRLARGQKRAHREQQVSQRTIIVSTTTTTTTIIEHE